MQQTLTTTFQRLSNFLGFTMNYLKRKNPILAFMDQMENAVKDILLLNKKKKMAQYRLSYQIHQMQEMEELRASCNEHTFLKGQKFNTMR